MIRQADIVEVEVWPSNRSGWAKRIGQCALSVALVVVVYLFYLSRQQPQTWEVERIYQTEPGSRPNTLIIRDTGEVVQELVAPNQQAKGMDNGNGHQI